MATGVRQKLGDVHKDPVAGSLHGAPRILNNRRPSVLTDYYVLGFPDSRIVLGATRAHAALVLANESSAGYSLTGSAR